jgi:large subunit ribosomal protein L11
MAEVIEALVDGGKATAGPPIGPALGPLGMNIMEVINTINEKTRDFEGMKVPVRLIIDPVSKEFEVEVGTPPTSALILKEIGEEKGSGNPPSAVGDLSLEQAVKIAGIKEPSMLGPTLKERVLEILGTCVSMGVTVEGKPAREVQKAVKEGFHNGYFGVAK